MSAKNIQLQALSLLATLENAGKSVSRVTIEGRRIEIEFEKGEDRDEFDRIEMRHGKT